jgi:glycosyltransferase involved in cell wall biosynthesis
VRLSLIVTTYERPEALQAVLASVAAQTGAAGAFPDEVIVADDGSGAATRAVIEEFSARAPCPVIHARQEHEGFRVCRARNLAIAHASGEYVVTIDGDMMLHPAFIADHRQAARRGCYVQGTRILADERLTRSLLEGAQPPLTPLSAGLGGLRRLYAAHLPRASRACSLLANTFVAVKSCNQGVWREDLERVNGYNEEMTGWGSEDKELAARLAHAGVDRRTLLFAGIAFHLHHAPASRERHAINQSIYRQTLATRLVRAARGLDAHRTGAQRAAAPASARQLR